MKLGKKNHKIDPLVVARGCSLVPFDFLPSKIDLFKIITKTILVESSAK